jgi:hypothetical protein
MKDAPSWELMKSLFATMCLLWSSKLRDVPEAWRASKSANPAQHALSERRTVGAAEKVEAMVWRIALAVWRGSLKVINYLLK